MIDYFARFWNRARRTLGPGRASEGDPLVVSPDARVSLVSNGAVFLHARSGIVFTSNHIGARIWQGLLDREGVETIAARISQEAGVWLDQVRQDTAEFVADLEAQGFLSRRIGC
jgi:Coenzyme PQQ synthesis protein D (PqqD)